MDLPWKSKSMKVSWWKERKEKLVGLERREGTIVLGRVNIVKMSQYDLNSNRINKYNAIDWSRDHQRNLQKISSSLSRDFIFNYFWVYHKTFISPFLAFCVFGSWIRVLNFDSIFSSDCYWLQGLRVYDFE